MVKLSDAVLQDTGLSIEELAFYYTVAENQIN